MAGVTDIHVHAHPDRTARSLDAVTLGRRYREHGFRAFVLMNHFDSTAGLAYLVRQCVPDIPVFGGIVLNHLIGGMNRHAVRHTASLEGRCGRIVYMPTTCAENEVCQGRHPEAPRIPVSSKGRLLPEVLAMLDLVAELDLVLSTGHSSPREVLLLVEAAKQRGIRRILVTNPLYWAIRMSVSEMQAAAEMGAWIEFIYYCLARPDATVTFHDYAGAIRAIGPEHCILSSCGGQAWMPDPIEAWTRLLTGLREQGLSWEALEMMSRTNPAGLLELG